MTTSITVAELALRLHETEKADLRLQLDPGMQVVNEQLVEGYELHADSIEFASLDQRNRRVAALAYARISSQLADTPGVVFECAHDIWCREIDHENQASARLLSLAAKRVDILACAAQRIREGGDVFEVLILLEACVPLLDSMNLPSLIDLCEVKYEKTKNDLAGGTFHGPFETWLSARPDFAKALHSAVVSHLTEATVNLINGAIVALAKMDYPGAFKLASEDARDTSVLRSKAGIWSLYRLLHVATAEARDAVCAEISGFIESHDDDVRKHSILVATRSMHLVSGFDTTLKRLAIAKDQDVLAGVATALFLQRNEMGNREDLREWITLLGALSPTGGNSTNNLDLALSQLLAQPDKVGMVVAMLTDWTERHGKNAVFDDTIAICFDSTFEKLCRLEPTWSALLTDWLLSDSMLHAANLSGLLGRLRKLDLLKLRLHKERLDALDDADLVFLVRRMLGYVSDRAQITSLALSALSSAKADVRIFPLWRHLLCDEVGYDYPERTIEACRAAAIGADVQTAQFLGEVVAELEASEKSLDALPRLRELRPPSGLRDQFASARYRKMNDDMRRSQKDAIWRHVGTEIPVKAGKGTFSYYNASYSPTMDMASMPFSYQLARTEVFDPVGREMRLLNNRLAKKGKA